jgi:hypothetical protein
LRTVDVRGAVVEQVPAIGAYPGAGGGGRPPGSEQIMAKGQQKKTKEARKPKAEKPPKQNASNPSTKGDPVKMTTIKS